MYRPLKIPLIITKVFNIHATFLAPGYIVNVFVTLCYKYVLVFLVLRKHYPFSPF